MTCLTYSFFGVTTSQLLCGTKTERGLETHRKFLDLLIKLVVNSPFAPSHDAVMALVVVPARA